MIYLDTSALLKFVKAERESGALREWRVGLQSDVELVTSQLATLEISRTLLRAGVDHERVPYVVGQALRGVYLVDVTSTASPSSLRAEATASPGPPRPQGRKPSRIPSRPSGKVQSDEACQPRNRVGTTTTST